MLYIKEKEFYIYGSKLCKRLSEFGKQSSMGQLKTKNVNAQIPEERILKFTSISKKQPEIENYTKAMKTVAKDKLQT